MDSSVWMALLATLATWGLTALGAATVVFFRSPDVRVMNILLGFAAGVMIAASFWSLLAPAVERAEKSSALPAFAVVTLGFLAGALFLWGSDKVVTRAQGAGASPHRTLMLILSITLHNILCLSISTTRIISYATTPHISRTHIITLLRETASGRKEY